MSTQEQPPPPPPPAPPAPSKTVQAPEDICQKVEAALMTTDRPLNSARMSQLFGKVTGKTISDAVARLNSEYESTGRTFRIEPVAGGWQIMTIPDYADVLTAMHKTRQQTRLSPAAMETLAIIAYKQPIVRAEIEAVRGVASGEMLRSLMDRHLVKIVGRAEELGRPMLYGTTKTFLEVFGLATLKDLPNAEEFVPRPSQKPGNGAAAQQAQPAQQVDQDAG